LQNEPQALRQQWAGDDVLHDDREGGVEVGVRGRGSEPVAEHQLLESVARRLWRHVVPAADDAAPEDVSLQMDSARKALREQSRDR
jgi:hypothetical protein